MPDRFRRLERSEWADANREGEPVDCFLEGPCFDSMGRLYVVDIPYGRIFRIEDDDWTMVTEYPGWPNGLKVQPGGVSLAADYRHWLVRIDPGSGATSAVLQTVMSESFKGLNDLTLHADESILFTNPGAARVWRLHKGGRLDKLISTGPSPNGLVLNTAQTHLCVAMTQSCEVWRFLVRPDAVVAKAQCFARMPEGVVGPDGLAMDSSDRLYNSNRGHGCVWVIDQHRVPLYRVQSSTGQITTNCAVTPDGRGRVITESETGTILIAEIPSA